jgi:hypothetical protein
MNFTGKQNADGSIELSVQLTKTEAEALHSDPVGLFGSKSKYCLTCLVPPRGARPSETIEAFGDVHANAIAVTKCGVSYRLTSGGC